MNDKDKVNLGLMGLGWGEQTALAIEQLPGVRLLGCYSRNEKTRERFANLHHCFAYPTYDALISDSKLDGVVIMTPNKAHYHQVIEAAKAGKHILVTKPFSTSLEEGLEMINACERAGVLLSVGHQSRREKSIRTLRSLLDKQELGQVVLVESNISTGGGLSITEKQWRWSEEECPGGVLAQLGIHHIDTLQYLFGPIVGVYGRQKQQYIRAPINDISQALLEFESGLVGYLGSTYASREACWIRIYGSIKNAYYEQLVGLQVCNDTWEGGLSRILISEPDQFVLLLSTIIEEVREFVECICYNKKPEIDGIQGLQNLAVALAIIESSKCGGFVQVQKVISNQ
jgi:predicted dehydrogenase